jgi:hypothetical protein
MRYIEKLKLRKQRQRAHWMGRGESLGPRRPNYGSRMDRAKHIGRCVGAFGGLAKKSPFKGVCGHAPALIFKRCHF